MQVLHRSAIYDQTLMNRYYRHIAMSSTKENELKSKTTLSQNIFSSSVAEIS
jgi:hypothetical protein